MSPMLRPTEPMGIYQMLYAFMQATGSYMGDVGTHPWSQGFPLTSPVPGGPSLPASIAISDRDLMYPKAWGHPKLRELISEYYNSTYGTKLSPENIMVFAGGRAALFAVFFLLDPKATIVVEETEYTPYYDLFQILGKTPCIVPSNEENSFLPSLEDYKSVEPAGTIVRLRSNPCNPTGQVMQGSLLQQFVADSTGTNRAAVFDEAYEFFVDPEPVSALAYVRDIDETNHFVVGAATKGLQAPGIRVGWVVASKQNVEIMSNYSSFVMGGVSRPSQLFAETLFEPQRIKHARQAIAKFYTNQRHRYGEALDKIGIKLFTGNGGFYHWGKLPAGLSADEFNQRLFQHNAAILPGRLCDMLRRGTASAFDQFFRFSFGPLLPDSFEEDVKILRAALA